REVLEQIDSVYGSRKQRHPITRENMHLKWNPLGLWTEARIKFKDTSLPRLFKMAWGSMKARIAMAFDIQGWGKYPQLFIESTDNEKFDDMIRMIISGTADQQQKLREFLNTQRQRGDLVYGIHTAQEALVTCIVYDYFGKQVHFVDASDGGYALASKELKAQLKAREPQAPLSDPVLA
ncbi:MAG TPA: DUF3095 family protein, partial [Phototrophicaceae bacterium]|nr:DUF3095 family protein [Phototrophicaceae bacterium]